MHTPEPTDSDRRAARETGRLLVQIRWLAIAGQIAATFFAAQVLGLALPLERMAVVIAGLVGFNGIIALAMRRGARLPDAMLALQLGVDTLTLAALIALAGATASPLCHAAPRAASAGAVALFPAGRRCRSISWRTSASGRWSPSARCPARRWCRPSGSARR
ncbi:hypothetical protein ACTTAI_04435 [Rhodobacter capsulatus]|uniref:hypothetical protein n=1 Tax=Rhodobacter capsulatus TaxID=1061 RepID=UPI0040280878